MSAVSPVQNASEIPFGTDPQARPDDRLTRLCGRKAVMALFVVALLVRIIYLTVVTQPPVQFDARRYTGAGLALSLTLGNPSLLADSAARAGIDFHLLYTDRISDEPVIWLTSHPPDFPGALDDVFFAGPVYPAIIGAVFALSPRYDFLVIRLLQALLDSLTAVLIWSLARRLVSPSAGWWAAGIWIFYGPALYKVGEIVPTTMSIFLLVLAVWMLVRACDTDRVRWLWAVGIALALLAMIKAAALGLIGVLPAAWFWSARRRPRRAVVGAIHILLGTGLTMVPWLLTVWMRYGTLGARDPAYAGGNFRSSNILYGEGYDLDTVPADFWTYPVWREIRNHPGAYARMYARKFYRLWSRPYDDFRRGFPLGVTGVLWTHRIIVVLALFGLFVWSARAGPIAAIPVFVIGYFTLLHMAMHVVARYNMMSMPMVGIAATIGAGWLLGGTRSGRVRRTALAVVTFGALLAAIQLLRPPFWLIADPLFGWKSATAAYWMVGTAVIAGAVWLLTRDRRLEHRRRTGIGVAVVLALVFLTQVIPREGHAEWSVRLDDPAVMARRTVTMPDWLVADSVYRGFVSIDAVAEEHRDFDAELTIDGVTLFLRADSLGEQTFFYTKHSFPAFMLLYNHRQSDIRRWVINELDRALVDSMITDRRLTISLRAQPSGDNPGALLLFGDLPVDDYREWIGPMFDLSSVERYYEGGDPRLWGHQPLDFVTARSELVIDGQPRSEDLSNRWGRQIGQYRMLVTIITPGGRYISF